MSPMPLLQTSENKKGEVEFRRKLAPQFEGKKVVYTGEPGFKEYIKIIRDRIKNYTLVFKSLNKKGVTFSPFLEFGAGIGQGSMLLASKFKAKGFCTDISYKTLKLAFKYKKILKYQKMPTMVTCDAYNIPLKNASVPFVFCFQTLHHFPDPRPVLTEVKRVLAPEGYFYFGEEPVAQSINLNLWRRATHLTWWEKILKATTILHFISRIGKSEVGHGILEETFNLDTLEKALDQFESVEVTIRIFPLGPTFKRTKTDNKGWLTPPFYLNIFLKLLGGGIEALCKKESHSNELNHLITNNLKTYLKCPNCKTPNTLSTRYNSLNCSKCKKKYKKKSGIFKMFSSQTEKLLKIN